MRAKLERWGARRASEAVEHSRALLDSEDGAHSAIAVAA